MWNESICNNTGICCMLIGTMKLCILKRKEKRKLKSHHLNFNHYAYTWHFYPTTRKQKFVMDLLRQKHSWKLQRFFSKCKNEQQRWNWNRNSKTCETWSEYNLGVSSGPWRIFQSASLLATSHWIITWTMICLFDLVKRCKQTCWYWMTLVSVQWITTNNWILWKSSRTGMLENQPSSSANYRPQTGSTCLRMKPWLMPSWIVWFIHHIESG